jgi:chromosome segregation protein
MHLQSLELFGFKSFADKTVFNFHEGVTAIVGPNGCGKSNVLDAVRWVLGEQSAKALRGGEMADVIFNGTDTRKPLSFAEVSLTFTNCSQELGLDWHDVRVTRRVYRDGNSEYLLNKTVCRLKDVHSLFADTGVGRSAYSMMEQGKIDLILSSRPEDRRAVFEEAAGITKYKTLKREALRKLEATEANLLRIGDIIKEVKRQIGSLQRQAGKARRYQALHSDLRILDTHHSRQQLDQLENQLAQCRAESERLGQSERATQTRIETGEDRLTDERHDLDEVDDKIAETRGQVQRLQTEIAAHRNRIQFNQQREEEFSELIERYCGDISAAETKRTEQESQIHQADLLIEKTQRLLATKEDELEKWNGKASQLRLERAERDEQLNNLQISISKLEAKVSALEGELKGNNARREATAARITDLEGAITLAIAEQEEIGKKLSKARDSLRDEQEASKKLADRALEAEKQLQTAERVVTGGQQHLLGLEREIAEKQSRLDVLRQLNEEGEGLAQGSQAVLRGLDQPERFRPALAGALVSHLNVDREFVAAIEAALGRNTHAIVLQETGLASEIMATLTNHKLGQAALALTGLAESTPALIDLPQGALAWAIDTVAAPDALQPLVKRLLHNVAIVRDLTEALALKKDFKQLQFATLSGEFLSAEGIVFGGVANAQADSLLERKARIDVLQAECGALEEKRDALVEERLAASAQLESAKRNLEQTRQQHQAAHLSHSSASGQIQLAERDQQEAERKLGALKNERETLDRQMKNSDVRISELQGVLTSHQQAIVEQQAKRKELETAREDALRLEEEAAAQLNELRLAVATERQRQDNLAAQRQPMTAREAELAELIAARRTDIVKYQERIVLEKKESGAAEAEIAEQTIACATAEAEVAAMAEQRTERVEAVNRLETELRGLRNSLNDVRDLRGKEEVRQTQLQLRIENLAEHVMRRYQVDLREFERDHFAFAKTLQVQFKRRGKNDADVEHDGESGGARPSRPGDGASADNQSAEEGPFGEGGESGRPGRLRSPESEAAHIDASQLEKIIAELTRQLDNMGPVNLDAVHEYDELEERYRFLETQNNDLTASRRELLDTITHINNTTRTLFAETFTQVRANFREMFAEMFGGGRADLSLMDENDALNCGIEITAKPPGKQLQSISLLSGGERTMTAVALLFAIYMVRPSPFCILDEMDAPLDESNINRFIRVLERFVKQSQFVIITHNKRTIAKADILYGVTMEERGVSKLVGMKLMDPQPAEKNGSQPATEAKPTQPQFALEATESPRTFAARR